MSNNTLRKLALAAMFTVSIALHAQSGPTAANTASAHDASAQPTTVASSATAQPVTSNIRNDMASQAKPAKKKKVKESADENIRPDDPKKNPWWEPRDWDYINEQGP